MNLSNLFDVVDKSTNKSSKRKRSDSQSSKSSINSDSDSSINSPTHVPQEVTYTLDCEISYLGGFSNLPVEAIFENMHLYSPQQNCSLQKNVKSMSGSLLLHYTMFLVLVVKTLNKELTRFYLS